MPNERSSGVSLTKLIAVLIGAVAIGVMSGTALAGEIDGDAVSADDFLRWAQANAIEVDDWAMNPALAAYLDTALEGKRIIFIGEPGHFFSEKFDVQLMLIRYLADKGYRHLFLEGLGASMAPAVDRYVSKGEKPDVMTPAEKDSPAARYNDRAAIGWVGADAPDFKKRQSATSLRFRRSLRAINESLGEGVAPLRIHPLDLDMMPGGCYHSIDALLEPFADDAALAEVRSLATRVEGETNDEEIERLERLRELIRDNTDGALNSLSAVQRAELFNYADCLVETIVFFETARADGRLVRALVRREPAMYRQVKAAMDTLPDDAKVIMMAHNNHLCKDGTDISRARKPSLGEMINDAYPGEVYCMWMLHDHGWLLNPMAEVPLEELKSDPARLESILIRAGATYVLPLGTGEAGEKYLAQQREYSYFSWSQTGTLTKQVDAIFFIDEITPLKED